MSVLDFFEREELEAGEAEPETPGLL